VPPEYTHLFVDRYGQLPADFWQQPEDPAAAQRWEQGRAHIRQLVQVCGGGDDHGRSTTKGMSHWCGESSARAWGWLKTNVQNRVQAGEVDACGVGTLARREGSRTVQVTLTCSDCCTLQHGPLNASRVQVVLMCAPCCC
jgi:hypothetical protein